VILLYDQSNLNRSNVWFISL